MLHNRTERRFGFALIVLGLCLSSLAWAQKPAASKSASVLATAKSQLGRGDLESAESNLWSVLGSEPTNEQALAMLGMGLDQMLKADGAKPDNLPKPGTFAWHQFGQDKDKNKVQGWA